MLWDRPMVAMVNPYSRQRGCLLHPIQRPWVGSGNGLYKRQR